jgi:hypothetical protein
LAELATSGDCSRREGPLSLATLGECISLGNEELGGVVSRVLKNDRIERIDATRPSFRTRSMVTLLGTRSGWEAAVYDHFHAQVQPVIAKSRLVAGGAWQSVFEKEDENGS